MDILRSRIGFSLRDLELAMFSWMANQFADAFRTTLEELDARIARQRDRGRYRLKGRQARELQTLFGVCVRFHRRRYYDRVERRWVYLLDEVMQLPAHRQVSPALAAWTLSEAVWSSSYRSAANGLKAMYGHPVVSHESVRQLVLEMGQELEKKKAEQLEQPGGTRRAGLVFLLIIWRIRRDTSESLTHTFNAAAENPSFQGLTARPSPREALADLSRQASLQPSTDHTASQEREQ